MAGIVLRALMTDDESVEHGIVPSADRPTLSVMPTKGFAVSYENIPDHHIPAADEPSVPELEADETIPPRPEEKIADVLRAEPDLEDHSGHPEARATSDDDPMRAPHRVVDARRVS